MIRVDRPAPAPADVLVALSKPMKDGRTELEAARAYYSSKPAPLKSYKFRRYKEFEVCQALDSLFHGKCAYCESPYRAVDALDVEHFRPKGGVSESTGHPGYWWLAAAWNNLLPSCPACNQRRKHIHYYLGMTAEDFERELKKAPIHATGKGNSFPVTANNWVTLEEGEIAIEDPLLINPCERDPSQHLEWVFDRDAKKPIWNAAPLMAVARARLTADGNQDRYGQASISIYGLNRSGLFRERIERLRELQRVSQTVVDVIKDLAEKKDTYNAKPKYLLERLIKYKSELMSYTLPVERYSSMASAYVREFNKDLHAHLRVP